VQVHSVRSRHRLPVHMHASPFDLMHATPDELRKVISDLQRQLDSLKSENERLQGKPASAPPRSKPPAAPTPPLEGPLRTPVRVYSSKEIESAVKWPKPEGKFWEVPPRDAEVTLADVSPPGRARVEVDVTPMQIVHMASEMAPCAKVGGLGDVVQGLAKASLERGHSVQV
jgi:hypothetical protein